MHGVLVRKIEVVDYDPTWTERFSDESILLKKVLGVVSIAIHHIGSTSVPGLASKPIIDILIEVTSLNEIDELDAEMSKIGYESKGEFGISGRRYFQKGGDNRTHQIHAFRTGDENVMRHVAFRDYLRKNADVARDYGKLKRKVAESCDNDIEKYCDGKDEFVKTHERIAVAQFSPNQSQKRDRASL